MTAQAVWDPIDGSAHAARPASVAPHTAPLDRLVRKLTGPMLILSLIGFCLAIFSDRLMFLGIALACLGFAFVFFGDKLSGTEDNRRARIQSAAAALGHLGGTEMPKSRVTELGRKLRSMMMLRFGGSIPLVLTHELWGKTGADVPFWMGLSIHGSQAFLGGPKAAAQIDATSSLGDVAMFVVAYRLDRDTGLRVEILPEFASAIGPLDRDIKTESVEFNRFYNIRLTLNDGAPVVEQQATASLLRVLTPALQVVLIGLAERYAARVIIDRETVFFGGYRNMQTTDETALGALLQTAIDDFADAATAFKTYAE